MKEQPFQRILDRDAGQSLAAQHLQPQIELLEDLVNYGTSLIARVLATKDQKARTVGDLVAIGVLLRQIVAMGDGVHLSLTVGAIHNAVLSLRAGFEASLYLQWMLYSDLETKASHYYVGNLRQKRAWAQRATTGTKESVEFEAIVKQIGVDLKTLQPKWAAAAATQIGEIDKTLALPKYASINQAFDTEKKTKKKDRHDPNWYEVLGAPSIRSLAKTLHRAAEYELVYSKGSKVTHTSDLMPHVTVGDDQVSINPIRSLAGAQDLIVNTAGILIRTYKDVLSFYRNEELQAFSTKYLNDWQRPFLETPNIKIQTHATAI